MKINIQKHKRQYDMKKMTEAGVKLEKSEHSQ